MRCSILVQHWKLLQCKILIQFISGFFIGRLLRIDKGSLRGALYLGTCIHNNGSGNGILYILCKVIFFSIF